MKKLKTYIEEVFNPEWDYVTEMANVGYPTLDRTNYNITIHGTNSGDRERPHFHIYLRNDVRPFNKFNIEIALDELLCYDELNIIRIKDQAKHIDIYNRSKCNWKGYARIKDDLEDWLNDKSERRGDFIDNLDAIIYFYNLECGNQYDDDQNALLEYIKKKGMKVDEKYSKYFTDTEKEKYKECF